MWRIHLTALSGLLALIVPIVAAFPAHGRFSGFDGLDEDNPMRVDKKRREIRILADLQPAAFAPGLFKFTPGYHAVVWKRGKMAGEALLASYANDVELYDALISIGAKPGNNVPIAAWNERNNVNSPAPRTRVEGTPVEMLVWWDGLPEPIALASMLIDPGRRGIDLRFGGHKANVPIWRSGCIVCLQSCPGGKIGNHSYTIRDYMDGKSTFAVNQKVVPEGKRRAVVILQLKKD